MAIEHSELSLSLSVVMELTTTLDCWRRGVDERVAALLHVVHRIDEFFDASACYTPPQAAGAHSPRLLDRVLNRLSTHDATEPYWCRRAMIIAIEHGDLDMVQRVHAYHPCPLGSNVFAAAAECGHLPVLQWLFHHRSDGLCQLEPPHRFTNGEMTCCMSRLITIAIENEQSAVAKWLFLTGYTNEASDLGDLAAEQGDLEFVKVLHERQIPYAFTSCAVLVAVLHGRLDVLKNFAKQHLTHSNKYMREELALLHGHEEVADYLRANRRYQKVYDILPCASELGRLDILQAKRDRRGLDWGSALLSAVRMDHREIVRCLCTESPVKTCQIPLEEAITHGDLAVLKCLYDNHIGEWKGDTMTFAAASGRLEIMRWLHECLTDACPSDAMDQAASNGHLHVVEWLHINRNEGCTTDARDGAAANGHLHVLQWLHATAQKAVPFER